jgi:hypothetical protein
MKLRAQKLAAKLSMMLQVRCNDCIGVTGDWYGSTMAKKTCLLISELSLVGKKNNIVSVLKRPLERGGKKEGKTGLSLRSMS